MGNKTFIEKIKIWLANMCWKYFLKFNNLTENEYFNQIKEQELIIDIDNLVNKFLAWKLPKSVCSDLCVTDNNYPYSRTGTNLLTTTEAKEMIEYLLKVNIDN